ncbi:peptidyl-prolyl cis-trans isomerase, cyclophilin-type, partial [Prevotella disiens JCM 6334 = ATCC 29426]
MKKNMKKFFATLVLCLATIGIQAQTDNIRHEIEMVTDSGKIVIALYNETPQHRDNFLKNVKEGIYDGQLFHRVIKDFMIQAGDPASKTATKGQMLGDSDDKYTVPAEIVYPKLFHKRGAVAAARESDDVNPQRASSATQFYIVWGRKFSDNQLAWAQERIDKYTNGQIKITPEIGNIYKTVGGTPHLDGSY